MVFPTNCYISILCEASFLTANRSDFFFRHQNTRVWPGPDSVRLPVAECNAPEGSMENGGVVRTLGLRPGFGEYPLSPRADNAMSYRAAAAHYTATGT